MSINGELNPMAEHRISKAFDDNREHIIKPNTTSIAYPDQHIDIEILNGSRVHVMVPDTIPSKLRLILILHQQTRHVVL